MNYFSSIEWNMSAIFLTFLDEKVEESTTWSWCQQQISAYLVLSSYAKIKHSDWVLQVTRLDLTNMCAFFYMV